MKLLVVLSAMVATTLARPGYLGAGISGLLGNGIGAPALAGRGVLAPGVIGGPGAAYLGAGPAIFGAGGAPVGGPVIGGPGAAYLGAGAAIFGAGGAPVGGPANIVIGPNGVPADTPEVAAAKAGHAKVVAETQARDAAQAAADAAAGIYPGVGAGSGVYTGVGAGSGVYAGVGAGSGVYAGVGAGFGAGIGPGAGVGGGAPGAGLALYGPANIVIGPDGVPHDTPEVASAKAAHADLVAQTQARDAAQAAADAASGRVGAAYAGVGYAGLGLGAAAAPSHGLARYGPANIQIGPGGVPLDTPEVAAGKVADAVAHLQAKARLGLIGG